VRRRNSNRRAQEAGFEFSGHAENYISAGLTWLAVGAVADTRISLD
jgi:hypothetical protein